MSLAKTEKMTHAIVFSPNDFPKAIFSEETVASMIHLDEQTNGGFIAKHLTQFLNESIQQLLEIDQALKKNQWNIVRNKIHKLSGHAAMIGLFQVHKSSKTLEETLGDFAPSTTLSVAQLAPEAQKQIQLWREHLSEAIHKIKTILAKN